MKSHAFWEKYREMAAMQTPINKETSIDVSPFTPSFLTVSGFRKPYKYLGFFFFIIFFFIYFEWL